MKPEPIAAKLDGLPHMTADRGRWLWEFLVENELRDSLELGFFHGVSSAYIAAAIDELGGGHLHTVDVPFARTLDPQIEAVLDRVGLSHNVSVHIEPTSYTWWLLRELERDPTPRFDFCFIDGAHSWDADGFAFFLAEKLLRPGGWLLLDDLDWSFASSPTMAKLPHVQAMPDAEREMPQIRKVWELLVKPHPHFDQLREQDGWAFGRKSPEAGSGSPVVKHETVVAPAGGLRKKAAAVKRRLSG